MGSIETLSFLKDFQCHSCTRCCRNWRINLNQLDHQILSPIITQHYGSIEKYLEPSSNDTLNYSALKHTATGACVFLNEKTNLCRIQSEHGVNFLPDACRTYPRIRSKVGENSNYTLTPTCPTVAASLLDREGPKVVTQENFDINIFNGLKIKIDPVSFPLKSRTLSYEAYSCLKKYLVEAINERTLAVDNALVYLATVLTKVHDRQGNSIIEMNEILQMITTERTNNFPDLNRQIENIKGNADQLLTVMGAWFSRPIFKTNSTIEKMADFIKMTPALFHSQHNNIVRPYLHRHHVVLRNYFALKIFQPFEDLRQRSIFFGFYHAFFAYCLIKLYLTHSIKSDDPPDSANHLIDTLSWVEMLLFHNDQTEKELADCFLQLSPISLVSLIKA